MPSDNAQVAVKLAPPLDTYHDAGPHSPSWETQQKDSMWSLVLLPQIHLLTFLLNRHGYMLTGLILNVTLLGIMITQLYLYYTTYRRFVAEMSRFSSRRSMQS
jgi:hypothetical protein